MIDVRFRDIWQRAILSCHDVPPNVCRVAMAISLRLYVGRGNCFPSYERLAEDAAVSRDTVIRAVKTLEAAGWLGVIRSKGRKSNSFTLLMPPSMAVDVGTCQAIDAELSQSMAPAEQSQAGATVATPEQSQAAATVAPVERPQAAAAVAEMKQSHIEAQTVAEPCHPKKIEENTPLTPQASSGTVAAFEKLWEVWENDTDKGRARAAFHRATSPSGLNVPAETIIEAARSRRIRRFTSNVPEAVPLARWLRDEGWAVAAKRSTSGERQAVQPARPLVFVEEGTPAWRAWQDAKRREGKRFTARSFPSQPGRLGWYFDSEWPVTVEACCV